MMNWLKKLTLFRLLTSNLVKKTDYNTKVSEIEKQLLIMIIIISILLHKNLIS